MSTEAGEENSNSGAQGSASTPGEWDFEAWASDAGLNRKTTTALRKEDLVQKKVLSLLCEDDVRRLKDVSVGQGRLLQEAVRCLAAGPGLAQQEINMPGPSTAQDTSSTQHTRQASNMTIRDIRQQATALGDAGKELDNWLQDNSVCPAIKCSNCSEKSPMAKAHHAISVMDPRAALTVKATSKKALHITQFLSESARCKQKNRRKDVVLSTASIGDDERLVLRTDDSHPYSGITLDEWGAANMRLLNGLLLSGELSRDHIEYYLAYTATINDFYAKFEWNSILNFDFQYREQQAQHGFPWGQINPMMELQLLIPRAPRSDNRAMPFKGKPMQPNRTQTECKQWIANNGYCRFGASCKFKHIPLPTHSNQNMAYPKNSAPSPPWFR